MYCNNCYSRDAKVFALVKKLLSENKDLSEEEALVLAEKEVAKENCTCS